VFLKRSD